LPRPPGKARQPSGPEEDEQQVEEGHDQQFEDAEAPLEQVLEHFT
jgi:hypothetical protein